MSGINALDAFDEKTGELNVIIESPQGRRNKFTYDPEKDLFALTGILPVGAVFPFDFGFIPNTLGGDGDPLDILILMEEPAFTGCLVPARLIGIIEGDQTEDGTTNRNDRLIAVAAKSRMYEDVKSLDDLSGAVVDQMEHFFISYNEIKGKKFEPLGRFGPEKARAIVEGSLVKK
jgi:inorganic pyrophosphatase